ncbi:hypothetical protein [Thiolapillus sp.]
MLRSASLPASNTRKINLHVAPESGIFPERFFPGLFDLAKVDVIHRLAVRLNNPGEKIPGKAG